MASLQMLAILFVLLRSAPSPEPKSIALRARALSPMAALQMLATRFVRLRSAPSPEPKSIALRARLPKSIALRVHTAYPAVAAA